jgi:hypothetical protein
MESKLEGLADELQLEIFYHLRFVSEDGPKSHMLSNTAGEARSSFSSLCRTSKRLRVIAESFLYGEAVTSDIDGARFAHRISRLLRITMERPALAAKIQSVEHDLIECGYKFKKSDAMFRSFYDSTEWNEHSARMHTAAEETWTGDILKVWKRQLRRNPELAQFGLLLRLCPNITNFHTQMLHEGASAFSTLLASDTKTDAIQHRSQSAFGKLEKVSIQSVAKRDDIDGHSQWFSQFASFLQGLPSLRHYSHDFFDLYESLHSAIPAFLLG